MPQKKQTKKIKVRDLKPKKDAKGGFVMSGQSSKQQDGGGNQTRIFGP